MAYEVHTPVFDGPFDLLLHLILREEVDLYEISLSAIVDAYMAELDRMLAIAEVARKAAAAAGSPDESGLLDLDVATEFLLIAATLVELKSRRLLPGRDDGDLDEEFALWEERDLLLARLLECKTFKDAARTLDRLSSLAGRSSPRTAGLEERFAALAPDLLENVTAEQLRAAYLRASVPKVVARIDVEHIAPIRASVQDAVEELIDELPRVGRISFRRLTEGLVERLEVVVRFLAVLELFKQGYLELDQPNTFGEIEIVWIGASIGFDEKVTIDSYDG